MESNSTNKDELKPDSLRMLKLRIYHMEKENFKTKKFKDNQMVDRIRKLIEAEVDKIDN